MKQLQKLYPHALVLLGFVLISLIYFYPVLQGKQILQSDIAQYTGMAKEQNDFRASDHQEPFWTNSAFGGMPTYQLGAKYPHDYIGMLDDAIRFLPRPADYLFLYFLGFYGLLLVLKVDPLKAFFGALAFGFSTYLIIILGVGHNAKAHAIGYMPLVIAGFILVFQKKYIWGGLLTMFAVALEINANHFQMTYYLLIFLLVLSGYFIYLAIKEKEFKPLFTSFGVLAIAGIFAIGANATNLLATAEYAKFSTRGKSELTLNPDGSKITGNSALSREYITEYSYGIAESFNLIAPRLFGGGNSEKLNTDSSVYKFMTQYGASPEEAQQFTENYGFTYWGQQPIVAAPAYIGIVVFFLGILGLYHDNRKIKYVFLAGALFSLVLSWGKNLSSVTDFFIDFVPMYDKFRAVSSIQVILELCFPVLAIMGFQSFFTQDKEKQWPSLWKASATVFGLIIGLFLLRSTFDFVGQMDSQLLQMFSQGQDKAFGTGFIDALKEDRKSLYAADLLRSGFFILIAAGVLWLFLKNKLAQNTTIILVGLVMVFDLVLVDKNYVDADGFVSKREVEVPFQETPADVQILQDKSHYRVFEVDGNLSSARSSYFHKSIGGYSAVKPRRMQQLFDYQIAKNNIEVLNMLNVKYIIQTDSTGAAFPVQNPNANGNAWFVKELKAVNSADAEITALDKLDSKNVAVYSPDDTGLLILKRMLLKNKSFVKDSLASIKLDFYKPNHLNYTSNNTNNGLAVFSEMYYRNGWKVTIDGKTAGIFRVNYVLRGMQIPAGKHTIEFKFEPQVVQTGSMITLFSFIGMMLLLVGGIYVEKKKSLNFKF
ncbi:YfhO family protein [Flavobacterium franklandianum]|uniref:YfhO family protein n=1 Tax=Flavobacterium franklandianum TaxID=2594430 RepID=A0A553CJT6_9FLAO|nr:YfhO family protein [Flavobacterium franklandianum]TRX20765.1 YfhO family protein [Flavobacterium franklandianum]